MDRLICGDVGYGKTQVAIRAAFKAVMDGKQVMILVPTTILAEQHFNTFRDRFTPYPIIVARTEQVQIGKGAKELVTRFKKEVLMYSSELTGSCRRMSSQKNLVFW